MIYIAQNIFDQYVTSVSDRDVTQRIWGYPFTELVNIANIAVSEIGLGDRRMHWSNFDERT